MGGGAVFPACLAQGSWLAPSVIFPPACPPRQDQLKQLQEILGSLSLQEEKTRASQLLLDQQVNSEAQRSSSLVAQLRAMVAEREAKVQQLELEIGQLGVQVSRALACLGPPSISKPWQVHPPSRESSATAAFHLPFLRPRHALPGSTLALCFPLASHPSPHTFPLLPLMVSLLCIKPVWGSASPLASLDPPRSRLLPAPAPHLWPSPS